MSLFFGIKNLSKYSQTKKIKNLLAGLFLTFIIPGIVYILVRNFVESIIYNPVTCYLTGGLIIKNSDKLETYRKKISKDFGKSKSV